MWSPRVNVIELARFHIIIYAKTELFSRLEHFRLLLGLKGDRLKIYSVLWLLSDRNLNVLISKTPQTSLCWRLSPPELAKSAQGNGKNQHLRPRGLLQLHEAGHGRQSARYLHLGRRNWTGQIFGFCRLRLVSPLWVCPNFVGSSLFINF